MNCELTLGVTDAYGNNAYNWDSDCLGNCGDGWIDIDLESHVVNYDADSYLMWWKPNLIGSDMMICGLRLYYTPPGGLVYLPADLIKR